MFHPNGLRIMILLFKDISFIRQYTVQCLTPSCPTFLKEKTWDSETLWENLPKRYYFWNIIKQKRKQVGHFGVGHVRVGHFGVIHDILHDIIWPNLGK